MTLPTDYVDGDVLTAADVNAITTAVNATIPVATIAAKGDLLVGLTNDSVGVLSVGTNGYLLSASSGATAGVAWVPSGGKVLQFAYDEVTTLESTTSTSQADIPGLSLSFTPVSASSNLLIELTARTSASSTGSSGTSRSGLIGIDYNAGATQKLVEVGRYLTAASTETAASTVPAVVRLVLPSTNTSARTIKGVFLASTNVNFQLLGANSPILLTVTEIAA